MEDNSRYRHRQQPSEEDSRTQEIRARIDKRDYIKLKSFNQLPE
jgi:hypothetical protein